MTGTRRRRRSAPRLDGAARRLRAGDDRRPAEPPRTATTRRGSCRCSAAIGRRMELAVLLQATLPGRAVHRTTATRSGVMGGIDPDYRRAFPWDESGWDRELLESVRAAFGLRRAEPALRADGVAMLAAEAGGLAFERRDGDRRLAVALNAGEEPVRLSLAADGTGSTAPRAPRRCWPSVDRRRRRPALVRGRRPALDRAAAALRGRRPAGLARLVPARSAARAADPILPRCPTYRWRCRAGSRRSSSPPSIEPESWSPPSTPSARSPIATSCSSARAAVRSSTVSQPPGRA